MIRKFIAESALVTGMRRAKRPTATELFTGVERPSVTLAKMCIAEMFKDIKKKCDGWQYDSAHFNFEGLDLHVYRTKDYSKTPIAYEYKVLGARVRRNDKSFTFSNDDLHLFTAAFRKWIGMATEYWQNKAEHDRQQAAVDTIASFFETKDKPDGNVHETLRSAEPTRQDRDAESLVTRLTG